MAKTALITGAYRGLGLESARQLIAKGFEVILTARKPEEGKKAVQSLSAKGKASFVPMDVSSDASITAAVRDISKWVDHLDALINNAAIFPDPSKSALDTTRAMLLDTFNVNTASALMVAQAFVPLLAKARPGPARIVNVSSGLGALSDMQNSCTAYSLSKTALNAVTRQLAAALAEKKIMVYSVCPGWVRTEMGGHNAPRSVPEGAEGIVWAASEAPSDQSGLFMRDHKTIPW
jgi:NAD(P)-dependent dehydrogenase (short-subunit alcohol dehydrogenase family)